MLPNACRTWYAMICLLEQLLMEVLVVAYSVCTDVSIQHGLDKGKISMLCAKHSMRC